MKNEPCRYKDCPALAVDRGRCPVHRMVLVTWTPYTPPPAPGPQDRPLFGEDLHD